MVQANIPKETWNDLLVGKVTCEFEFLALKILLTRLKMRIIKDSSPAVLQQCLIELNDFLNKNGSLPVVQKDLDKISRMRGIA